MGNNNILTVSNLKKYFYSSKGILKVLNGVNLSIKKGELFGLIGESGSGKSTLAYILMGIYQPTSGKIIFQNQGIEHDLKKRSKSIKKNIQIVFQDPGSSLNPSRSIFQSIELPLMIYSKIKKRKDRINKVKELLKLVDLQEDYIYKYPDMLSGGEKQRISILRVLAVEPSFIILDEPTSSLDMSVQAKIISILMRLKKDFDLSYLFITHNLVLMRNIASSIAIIYLGKICEIAPCSELFRNPIHPYTKMLLSSIPVLSDEEEKLKPKKKKSTIEVPSLLNIPSGCSFYTRCPEKIDICHESDPNMLEVSKGHFVRCHLYNKIESQLKI